MGALIFIGGAACAHDVPTRPAPLPRHAPATCASARAHHRPGKPDPAAAWVGREVRIETVDHGLYLGTLESVGPDAVVLDIALPSRPLRYLLPRSAVANLQPLDP
jgi:hypothetical protein